MAETTEEQFKEDDEEDDLQGYVRYMGGCIVSSST